MQRKFRIPVRRLLDSTMADNSMIDDFNIIAERLFRTEQIPASSPVPLNCAPLGRVCKLTDDGNAFEIVFGKKTNAL
uniref:Uncharacterized protein n=1 Tax=Magallana gigas TaxID=29159 RepID=K1PFA4_MAGGI